jgi:hypothetical protein
VNAGRLPVALLAAAGSAACGTVLEYRQEVTFLADGDLTVSSTGTNDCNTEAGYRLDSYMAEEIAAPELHIIGIYGAPRLSGLPYGQVVVQVERPGPSVLVLSAYEATRWIIEPHPDAMIERVIATGYQEQQIGAPIGVEVQTIDYVNSRDLLGLGVTWPSEADRGGECADFFGSDECELYGSAWRHELQRRIEELDRLVERAEDRTHLTLSTFHGCYEMSRFVLTETRPRDD